MIDYGAVNQAVTEFLKTRDGLSNPKKPKSFVSFVRGLTGILCGVSYTNDLDTKDILSFLEEVRDHEMYSLNNDGKMHCVSTLINSNVLAHPLYELTERDIMQYKPGSNQVGPGEFFFCFYDKNSTYGIDNTNGFDILLHQLAWELKTLNTNLTSPELFDHYAESDKVDRLLVVKPVSDADKPQQRSKYVCCDTKLWRDVFTHRGKNGTLVLL